MQWATIVIRAVDHHYGIRKMNVTSHEGLYEGNLYIQCEREANGFIEKPSCNGHGADD